MTRPVQSDFDDFRWWTLWELWAEQGIREPFADTPNFFTAADETDRVAFAERLLRELHEEGWARFVRRPWNAREWSEAAETELAPDEVAAAIASDSWRVHPLGEDANVWLIPTALDWKDADARRAFNVGIARARPQPRSET